MTEQSTRNEPLLKSGTLSPNPWDLTLSGQNGWSYTGGTRTEDRAPQGCDPSAASSAGMATGDFDAEAAPKHTDFDPSEANLLRAKIGLDKGVHFRARKGPGERITGSLHSGGRSGSGISAPGRPSEGDPSYRVSTGGAPAILTGGEAARSALSKPCSGCSAR